MNSKFTLILLALVIVANSQLVNMDWELFKLKHDKQYSTEREEMYRYNVFLDNLKLIEQYQAENPEAEYGVTKFADLTQAEFKSLYLGLDKSKAVASEPLGTLDSSNLSGDIPDSWDWRDHGAVTTAKDQGLCGSCWAFSAVGNIEGQYFLKYNNLTNLSVQQVVDCDPVDKGCGGGYMQNAFTWLSTTDGLEDWDVYPYFSFQGKCKINPSQQHVKVKGYLNVTTDEIDIAKALVQYGPLATGMNANPLQFYIKGILKPKICKDELNHGVLFVGYGNAKQLGKDTDYWIVKNSWGATWGEKGTFRIQRGKGRCAINTDVSTAVLV